jgi:hypothetical protein
MTTATPYSDGKRWSNDYLTPRELVRLLGPFDFDPCCPGKMPWKTARRMILAGKDSGLDVEWRGRVWMNPPYRGVLPWARRFAAHRNGIALLNGRSPETRATQTILAECAAVYLPARRLMFCWPNGRPTGQTWFPSILIGMTRADYESLDGIRDHPLFGGVLLKGPRR